MNCQIKNWKNDDIAKVDLNDNIFGLKRRDDLLVQIVNYQRAKAQAGTHACKGISEVSGTTKKPFRQKGTGSARQGSRRAPHMPGGGIVFGPVVRSHAHRLNKKVRRLALKTALSLRSKEGNLVVMDTFSIDNISTSSISKQLKKMNLTNALFIDGKEVNANFKQSITNIPYVNILPIQGLNVLSILKSEKLVFSEAGLLSLMTRLA